MHFHEIIFTGPNVTESPNKLLKQFPVKYFQSLFAIGLQLYQKETPTQLFSCDFC